MHFYIGKTVEVLKEADRFNSNIGIEIPAHDFYRPLALRLYSENNEYPNPLFPSADDIKELKNKNTARIWAFSHFLLDELDDGDVKGNARTKLPNLNTRYIYKYIESIRNVGFNGAIAGHSTLENFINLYAFARFANDETATPESVLKEYAKYIATDETYITLFRIFKYLENNSNWHQKLPLSDRIELFNTDIKSTEEALELFQTIEIRKEPIFDLHQPPLSFLKKLLMLDIMLSEKDSVKDHSIDNRL